MELEQLRKKVFLIGLIIYLLIFFAYKKQKLILTNYQILFKIFMDTMDIGTQEKERGIVELQPFVKMNLLMCNTALELRNMTEKVEFL